MIISNNDKYYEVKFNSTKQVIGWEECFNRFLDNPDIKNILTLKYKYFIIVSELTEEEVKLVLELI
jgi:hypothetical protein